MKCMTLTVPAKKECILVMRMTAAGVCALHDLPVDVMEDLRTAIDESCELLLHQDYVAETLTLCCEAKKDGLYVTITAQERTCQQCDDAADADIAKLIIGTLVKEVTLQQDESGVHGVVMALPAKA